MGGQQRARASDFSPAAVRVTALLVAFATLFAASLAVAVRPAVAGNGIAGVASTSGNLVIERRGSWRELEFAGGPARDADIRFDVASDKLATGRGQNVIVVARRTARQNEYRVRVRFNADGTVSLGVIRLVSGQRTFIGPVTRVAGLTREPGSFVAARVRLEGVAPTRIKVKLWSGGTLEPTSWTATLTDASAALTSAGWTGLRFAVPWSSTNAPVTYSYDRLQVTGSTPEEPEEPTPTPTPEPTPSRTATPDPDRTPTPTPTPTPSATSSPTSSPTVSPTPPQTPAPTATPTSTPAPNVPADAFVVSPDGSDAASGSASAPWKTLQKAADSVGAGATVLVRAGAYGPFTLRRSGTAANPIVFRNYPEEAPVVDGRNAVDYTVKLLSVSHVRLSGLTVKGGYADRQHGGGVLIESSSNVQLRDSVLTDNKSFGVRSQNSTYVLIADNEITHNAVGVHIGGAGQGTVVTRNLIHDNDRMMVNTPDVSGDDVGGEGVALVRSTGNVLVTENYIWGNRSPSYDYGYDGGAFSIYAASNWRIVGNVTWDNRNVLETGTDANKTPCDGGRFLRNLNYGATTVDRTVGMVLRCASNTLVANNTFRGMQYFVFDVSHFRGGWGGSIDGLHIVNNVVSVSAGKIYGIETALPSSVVIDENVLHNAGPGYLATYNGSGTTSLSTFRSWTGHEMDGIAADPRFVDAAGNDYRLRSDSPAVDSGRVIDGVTDGYAGAAPDRGYAELQ